MPDTLNGRVWPEDSIWVLDGRSRIRKEPGKSHRVEVDPHSERYSADIDGCPHSLVIVTRPTARSGLKNPLEVEVEEGY